MKRSVAFLLLVVLLVAAVTLPAPARSAAQSPAPVLSDRAGGAASGIDVTLAADAAPAPDGVVTLTLTARPLRVARDLFVQWELPDGGTLLDGPAFETLGPASAGESVSITRRVRFDAASVHEVRAKAFYFPNDATSLAASGVLFFDTRANNPTVSDLDPRLQPYAPPAERPTVDKSRLAGGSGRAADGCFNVTGRLMRENKMPVAVVVPETPAPAVPRYSSTYQDQTGPAVPVHHILVEMREEDTISDDSYGHTITDANGNFSFSFCDDDGFLNDELELYYRVCSEVRDGNNLIARIEETDEQELYCWDSGNIDSEGGNVAFDQAVYQLNQNQASIFNIADALYWGWRFWNDNTANSPAMDRSVTVYWQGGKGAKGSFYSDDRTTMVIADDSSSRDEWDDSVIIHEWGHFADHQFSCNQNPGGAHSLPGVNAGANGPRLAFGEGYPDYYQSAARTLLPGSANVSFYVDPDGPTVDLENMRGVTAGDRDEGAIAALMWDLIDGVNDNSDTVNHGHAALQRVYADPDFRGNNQCDMRRFLQVWRKLGLPTDAATAATIVQNVNVTLASLPPIVRSEQLAAASGPVNSGHRSLTTPDAAPPFDFRWWDQVTMVVDDSASMAAAGKINTVKAIIGEQVSDLAPAPQGTEFNIYTFNAGSAAVSPLVLGKFFANQIMPPVNALFATGPDAGCPVRGLGALNQAIQSKFDGEAWLYTDGDSADVLTADAMRLALDERRLHASIVLLGGCGSPARPQPAVTGNERTYLGLAADGSQSSGIVPYMLTALMSGGQFIYVAPDQLANAVDMVRAQLSHTAGAGKWSDYVSNGFTYRWDRLEPWEYQWFPANGLGTDQGSLGSTPKRVSLATPFPFYGLETSLVDVYEDGYILMNPCLVDPQFCFSNQYLEILDTDLKWYYEPFPPARSDSDEADEAAPADDRATTACGLPVHYGPQVHVFTANFAFEWIIISTEGLAEYPGAGTGCRGYQVWLNHLTGEIRYIYGPMRQEAATAEIGLISSLFFTGDNVIVSKNDVNGATNGTGYKFTPAPPQPSKTYEVEVDPFIESVVFMQTGYSGDFAPMSVTRPDDSVVNCADTANVKCITVNNKPGDNMVQFVQVNTGGTGGTFTAVVSVGPSGGGTFSFNALAASALRATAPGPHTLHLNDPHTLLLDLGRAADGNTLQGWFQTPGGAAFGGLFTLYDDGAHDDGAAGDGRFGSDPFNAPGAGAAYLWAEGTIGGTPFKRSDPTPFNFQPLYIYPPAYQEGYYGGSVEVTFWAENSHSVDHCYTVDFSLPPGWELYFSPNLPNVCIAANTTAPIVVNVGRLLGPDTLGEISQVGLTLTEQDDGAITAGATADVGLFRRPASLAFDNRQSDPIRPNGEDIVELTLNIYDDLGQLIGKSGPFMGEITVSGGTYTLPTGNYEDGRLRILFKAGTNPGTATISALAEGGLMAETTIELAEPAAASIVLGAAPTDLSEANTAQLTVQVRDLYGDPAVGETVRLSVSDDAGDQGTIGGGEVLEGATNKDGQMKATFVKAAGGAGQVVIRAELLGPGGAVLRETSVVLYLSGLPEGNTLYLPIVRR